MGGHAGLSLYHQGAAKKHKCYSKSVPARCYLRLLRDGINNSSLGEDVLEELQGSALQVGFVLCDGVAFVGELLLQLLQLLQVLTHLLETLCYCGEPAGRGGKDEGERRTRRK